MPIHEIVILGPFNVSQYFLKAVPGIQYTDSSSGAVTFENSMNSAATQISINSKAFITVGSTFTITLIAANFIGSEGISCVLYLEIFHLFFSDYCCTA